MKWENWDNGWISGNTEFTAKRGDFWGSVSYDVIKDKQI
jgi:hypothetical protein